MLKELLPAIKMTLILTVVCGLAYPALITGVCQIVFEEKANGSLIRKQGVPVGSTLIGQSFTRPEYFHGRPSAAGDGYDPLASGGSNLGPTSRKLADRLNVAVQAYRAENPALQGPIPADAVTASASGLDPHISVANAEIQVARVARARHLSEDAVLQLVRRFTEPRAFGVLGEPVVNVLQLNLELDRFSGGR
jgi:K+-transporting ATPase ATPase C chain